MGLPRLPRREDVRGASKSIGDEMSSAGAGSALNRVSSQPPCDVPSLTEDERRFLDKRSKLIKLWPIAAIVLSLLVAGLALWLFFTKPLLANPMHVLGKLEVGEIQSGAAYTMASILPFVVVTCLALCVVLIGFLFLAIANERKHIAVINRLTEGRKK
jgi:hypothetical protein